MPPSAAQSGRRAHFLLMGAGEIGGPQVGAPLAGQVLGLSTPPGRDPGMVAACERLRDRSPLPQLRPGILRIFKQAIGEAFLLGRGLAAHDAGKQAHAGIEQHEGCDLPAREHVVADRDLLEAACGDEALVDALEPAAEEHQPRTGRERRHPCLRERRPARAQEQARPCIVGPRGGIDGAGQHVGSHDHSRPPARRRVVDRAVAIGRMCADVERIEGPDAGGQRPARKARGQRPREQLGKDGENARAPHAIRGCSLHAAGQPRCGRRQCRPPAQTSR